MFGPKTATVWMSHALIQTEIWNAWDSKLIINTSDKRNTLRYRVFIRCLMFLFLLFRIFYAVWMSRVLTQTEIWDEWESRLIINTSDKSKTLHWITVLSPMQLELTLLCKPRPRQSLWMKRSIHTPFPLLGHPVSTQVETWGHHLQKAAWIERALYSLTFSPHWGTTVSTQVETGGAIRIITYIDW